MKDRATYCLIALAILFFPFFVYGGDKVTPHDDTSTTGRFSFDKFLQRAESGDTEAQVVVAQAFYTRDPRDLESAIKWFSRAANNGDPWAQLRLGEFYLNGEGVVQDNGEAVKWTMLSASQGFSQAQVKLGFMYYEGHAVPKDYVLAYKWFNIVAANTSEDWWYCDPVRIRDNLERLLTHDQIAEAQRLSREFKPTKMN